MADFADLGADREQKDRALALQQRAPNGPAATGYCLSCGVVLEGARRWCDADCRDDWQLEQKKGHAA